MFARKRIGAIALMGMLALVVTTALAVSAHGASKRALVGTCTPAADAQIGGGQGQGFVNVSCTGSGNSYTGNVRLVNAGGTILAQRNFSGTVSQGFSSGFANCSGQTVHGFSCINVNGVVKSDTGPNRSC